MKILLFYNKLRGGGDRCPATPCNEKIRKLRGQLRELAFLRIFNLVDFQQKSQC